MRFHFEEGCIYLDGKRNSGGYIGCSGGQGFTHYGHSHLSSPRPPMHCFVCGCANHLARDCQFKFFGSLAIHHNNAYINTIEQDVEQEESTKIIATDDVKNIEEALTKIVMNLDSCTMFNDTLILTQHDMSLVIKTNHHFHTHQDMINQHFHPPSSIVIATPREFNEN